MCCCEHWEGLRQRKLSTEAANMDDRSSWAAVGRDATEGPTPDDPDGWSSFPPRYLGLPPTPVTPQDLDTSFHFFLFPMLNDVMVFRAEH